MSGNQQQPEEASNASAPTKLEDQMEMVLQLMTQRTKGENTSAQIESTVSDILKSMGAAPPSQAPKDGNRAFEKSNNAINVDTDDYDDLDDTKPQSIAMPPTSEDNPMSNDTAESKVYRDWTEEEYYDRISQIPMGTEGAKMMTTFGDSRYPDPKALEVALLGTRRTLQLAMMDARAIRRKIKKRFDEAKKMSKRLDQSSLAKASSLDPTMLSRSLTAHDRLAYNLPCGFDIEQLESLYPEVMRAYRRWNDMYQRSQRKNATANKEDEANNNSDDEKDAKEENYNPDGQTEVLEEENTETLGGHLKERAAHFDTRTDNMKSEGYLKFSQVRQGSFLPRGKRQRKSKEDTEWEKRNNIKGKRGRQTDWEKMDARTIRFLHWLGFDPTTAMKPPDDATTQSLAFLGYDTMGRIVEKAIYLKNLESSNSSEGVELLGSKDLETWQLKPGAILLPEDIARALRDPEVQPTSMYALDGESGLSLQRYFGPGFEERLELELEELAGEDEGISKTAEEDREFRKEEAALFAKLSSPPILLRDVSELVDGQENTTGDESKKVPKRTRKK